MDKMRRRTERNTIVAKTDFWGKLAPNYEIITIFGNIQNFRNINSPSTRLDLSPIIIIIIIKESKIQVVSCEAFIVLNNENTKFVLHLLLCDNR